MIGVIVTWACLGLIAAQCVVGVWMIMTGRWLGDKR